MRTKPILGACVGLLASIGAWVSAGPVVVFPAERTAVSCQATSCVPFRVAEISTADRVFEAESTDPGLFEVVRRGEVLAGQTLGFVRVRGKHSGSGWLRIGESKIEIHVSDPIDAPVEPRIVSPVGAAAVWGTVGLSVEVVDRPGETVREISVALSDGSRLSAASQSPTSMGPHRRVFFSLETDNLPDGELVAWPVATKPDGDAERGAGVAMRVVRPAELIQGEGEQAYDVELPERFGRGNQSTAVGRNPEASGGAYRNNAGAYPPLCFPIKIERDGSYQVMLRVAGDLGGGALPTVALYVDNEDYPRMSARLASERWHRLPLGGPIRLEAGEHVLTAFFVNDFYVPGLADRNLRIDTIEVARLPDGALELPQLAKTGNGLMDARRDAMSMAMMAASMAGAESEADQMGVAGAALRVAFDRVLDGLPIAGQMEIKGLVHAVGALEAADPERVPLVSLLVNGENVASQRTLAPRFWVDAPMFRAGENTVQMVGEIEGGARAATPIQTMHYDIDPAAIDRPARRMHRFGLRDERWGADARERLARRGGGAEQVAFAFMSTGTGTLELPAELSGAHGCF